MEQYIEYVREKILDTVTSTTDKETLLLIYGILMEAITRQGPNPINA